VRVLVLGSQGMLGSALVRHLATGDFEVWGATSGRGEAQSGVLLQDVDVTRPGDVDRALDASRAEAVVNCAGVVKSECAAVGDERVAAVNARAPHAVAELAARRGARLVHVSTDCVFSGRRGSYREDDSTDAEDLYGQSKAAGEVREPHVTLRTSFIGRDPRRQRGLLEWLLARGGETTVPGFTRAMWSGLSAVELARVVAFVLLAPSMSGLYHVAGPVTSKADLLEVLVRELGLGCRVERVGGEVLDRTLDGSRFQQVTGYVPPSWAEMARELA